MGYGNSPPKYLGGNIVMAREKKPVTKLGAKHLIGYGAGDAGGVLMLMVISYLERFSRNILGIDPIVYAGILVVWNVWDAINDPWSVPSWTSPSPRPRTRPTSSGPGSCGPFPSWPSVWAAL